MRALIVLLLAALMPAFAADTPAPAEGGPQPSQPPQGYAWISLADVAKLTEILRKMTAALEAQDEEIHELRRRLARGGCV